MRVLQLANGYYKTQIYQHLFSHEEALGIENTIFVPINQNERIQASTKPNVHTYQCFHTLDRLLFYSKQTKMLNIIEKDFDMPSLDLIHAHTVFSGGYTAYQLHRRYGKPYMVAVRDTDVNTFFKHMPHLRKTGIEILCHGSRIVFLSEIYREHLLSTYVPSELHSVMRQKSITVPNGISGIFLENKGSVRTSLEDVIRLIFVGDLSARKNPELVIKAAKLLRQQGTNVSLKMVGQIRSPKYSRLLEAEPWVEYYPRCPQTEVIRHLRESDILVVPSHTETFGLVYPEAMSQGLPVLYTKGQGFDGQLPEGEAGYAISDRDARDIAEKILLVKENYQRLSGNCIAYSDRFDWSRIAEIYRQEYQKIL